MQARLVVIGALASGCGRLAFDERAVWTELGPSASGGGITNIVDAGFFGGPRLELTADERPVVAWADDTTGNDDVYLRMWNGTEWAELGGSAAPGGITRDLERSWLGGLAVGADGAIYQVHVGDDSNTMRLSYWNGTTWTGLGGSETAMITPGNPWWPTIDLIDGQPVVAWEDYGGGGLGVYASRFDGTAWSFVGTASPPGVDKARLVNIAGFDGSDVWLTGNGEDDAHITAAHWDGNAWTVVPPVSVANGIPVKRPSLALGDRPYVAWEAGTGEAQTVHLRAWDGAGWQELGNSASGDGIAAGQLPVQIVSLATMPGGWPVIAYGARGDVHVRAWNGTVWVAIGEQGEGGISQSGTAGWPTIEVGGSGSVFVAWIEQTSAGPQAYLRVLRE